MTDKQNDEGFLSHPYGDVFNNDFDKFQINDSSIWSNNYQADNEYQNFDNVNQDAYCGQSSYIPSDGLGQMHSAYTINDMSSIGVYNQSADEYNMMSYDSIRGVMNYHQPYSQNYSMMYRNPISSPDMNPHAMYSRLRHESGSASPTKHGYMSPMKSLSMMQSDESTMSPQIYNQKGNK